MLLANGKSRSQGASILVWAYWLCLNTATTRKRRDYTRKGRGQAHRTALLWIAVCAQEASKSLENDINPPENAISITPMSSLDHASKISTSLHCREDNHEGPGLQHVKMCTHLNHLCQQRVLKSKGETYFRNMLGNATFPSWLSSDFQLFSFKDSEEHRGTERRVAEVEM